MRPTVVWGAVAAVLLVAVVVLAVILIDRGGSGASDKAALGGKAQTTATPSVAPSAAPSAAAPPVVTARQMTAVLERYASAYSQEDVGSLADLFASDLVRQNGSEPPQDRAGALATYEQQFSQLVDPNYRLSGMRFAQGAGEGVAAGTYSITSQNPTVGGQIRFHLVLRNGQLLIDQITIRPD